MVRAWTSFLGNVAKRQVVSASTARKLNGAMIARLQDCSENAEHHPVKVEDTMVLVVGDVSLEGQPRTRLPWVRSRNKDHPSLSPAETKVAVAVRLFVLLSCGLSRTLPLRNFVMRAQFEIAD
jgi:hypothetical protein